MQRSLIKFLAGLITVGFAVLALGGCAHCWRHHHHHKGMANEAMSNTGVMYAVAVLSPTKLSRVRGKIFFTEEFGKVKVQGTIYGLKPNSKHGFHIHEYGDCTAPDATSAGGHYNPTHQPHGGLSGPHHAGDFGNIVADKHGVAHIDEMISGISLNGPMNPIIGRGVIVHKDADDLVSQPVGNAGPRLACGVIGASSAPKAPVAKPMKKTVKKVMRHRKQSP